MTVGDLRKMLADQPDDRPVVLARDAEGNGHSPLAEAIEAMYQAETTWAGEVYPTPEEIADSAGGWSEEDGAPDEAVRVVLLGPVN